MRNACVKIVHSLGTLRGKLPYLHTVVSFMRQRLVHIPRDCPLFVLTTTHTLVHWFFAHFTSVFQQVIPTVHSTYNKQLQTR